MSRSSVANVIALTTLLYVSICSAQQASTTAIPNLIRYSGTLKDAQGAVPSLTTVGVTFAIYKEQDGGAPVWQETHNVTPDANGQYSIVLGSATAPGLPDDLFSQQEKRWLGVQVQGQAEQARVMLVSVPYAFKAHEAETLGGLPASAFVKVPPPPDAGNAVSVNAVSAPAKSAATAAPNIVPPLPVGDCAFVANGFIPRWTIPPADTLCNSNIFQQFAGPSLNFVGINTSTPGALLDVSSPSSSISSGINTNNTKNAYMIRLTPVLSIFGVHNLSLGELAGPTNVGVNNTFAGFRSGFSNATGSANTYYGTGAGSNGVTGSGNTAIGNAAGQLNVGSNNTMVGLSACDQHAVGDKNTCTGAAAGIWATQGESNTFTGFSAGGAFPTLPNLGSFNTFSGAFSGTNATTGHNNTFSGYQAGYSNTTGSVNSFFGAGAGFNGTTGLGNTTGFQNTYIGVGAGGSGKTMTGSSNVFIGYEAGSAELDVSNNIEIGNTGPAPSFELGCHTGFPCSNQILIGTLDTHTDTYIQGIYNSVAGAWTPARPVCVDSKGKLWGGFLLDDHCNLIVHAKEQILEMGDSSSKLFQLRPVTFFYKPQHDDGTHALQYGLIAEEVAKVYPDMAIYDKDGQPISVNYQFLTPMLLNELQKHHTLVTTQKDAIKTQQEQIQTQAQQIQDLQQRLLRMESLLENK